MPGIDGLEAIALLRDRWPALPVLLTSSFADPQIITQATGLGARYLDKSFATGDLVTEVARLSGGNTRR
jgi:DNA-binding NarL/FixJ family response regulator